MSNEIKERQLGMSLGKANNILRKSIMFNLLQRLGEAYCFKCRKSIDSVDELSIEHKIPWLHNDIELYWDLENIAFSHLKCNRPERFNSIGMPRQHRPPEGMSWCSTCREFKTLNEFHKSKAQPYGVHYNCKTCRQSRNKPE